MNVTCWEVVTSGAPTTEVVTGGQGWMSRPKRRAVSSEMWLSVEPESASAVEAYPSISTANAYGEVEVGSGLATALCVRCGGPGGWRVSCRGRSSRVRGAALEGRGACVGGVGGRACGRGVSRLRGKCTRGGRSCSRVSRGVSCRGGRSYVRVSRGLSCSRVSRGVSCRGGRSYVPVSRGFSRRGGRSYVRVSRGGRSRRAVSSRRGGRVDGAGWSKGWNWR